MHKLSLFVTILLITGICLSEVVRSQPVSRDSTYSIKVNNIDMVISAAVGARVISVKLNGNEVLSSKSVHPAFYGSTLWLSPEGKWKGQGVLDNGGYKVDDYNKVNRFNGTDLHLISQKDSLRGFAFEKQFTVSPSDTAIIIRYTITNISKEMQEVAPWEVTRVPAGGLAFFPKGARDTPQSNKMYPLLNISDSMDMIWYPYDSSSLSPQKLFMNGEGWVAYVDNRVIFIKSFPVINPKEAAPGEKNVEAYVNRQKTYMELENQGAYTKLEQNGSLNYAVRWYVRKLPDNIKVRVGSPDLINYVHSILNKK